MLRRAIAAFASGEASVEEVLRWGWLAARAAIWLWDYDSGLEIPKRAVQLARDSGALEVLAVADNVCGQAAAWGGDFELAALLVAEVEAVKEATGSRIGPYAAISLAGLRGREAEASELIEGVLEGAAARRPGNGRPVRALGERRAHERPGSLRGGPRGGRGGDRRHAGALHRRVGAGRADRGRHEDRERRARERARSRASASRREASDADWALGIRAQARALLSEGEAAERAYREAIDRLGRTRLRPHLARAHLLYGEWLRREHRRVDARDAAARGARAVRGPIGMEAFAERARRELLATGETGAQAHRRDARRPDPAGAADRTTRSRRAVEPGDRRAALPQPAHRRMAPAQGVHASSASAPAKSCVRALPSSDSRPVPPEPPSDDPRVSGDQ